MSESKHTPGPWVVSLHSNSSYNGAAIVAPDGLRVASMPRVADRPYGHKQADAHLIAAAPELLEALKNARGIVCSRMCPAINGETLMHDDICKGILAAIAKAEGR